MSQDETAAFLERLAGRPPQTTQLAHVFVGAGCVYKVKRAVRLAFVDFTSLEERRRCLRREIDLCGPAAPGLYRDVVPLTRAGRALALDGEGEAVDWVLRMTPIPDADFMLRRVAGGLDGAMLDALGDMVAADHAGRPPAAGHDLKHPGRNARTNARSALDAGLPRRAVAEWLLGVGQALDAAAPLLRARAAAGLVRRTHGDLHLGNICVWQGRPVPFDALEFDEAMATVDLGYDLAFLLMDLDLRAGRPAANRVLNRYVARTGDAALVRLLPPFLSRRAMVRAHVSGERGYLDAALAYLRAPPGKLVAIGGLPGSGKSTLARALAPSLGPAPGALVLRSDEIRKRLHGVTPEQTLGRTAYRAEANARVDVALLDGMRQAGSHAVILDATFLSPGLRRAAARTGRLLTGIWLDAPLPELARRVRGRGGDASDATEAVLHRLAALDPGPIDWVRVPADEGALERCRAIVQ